MKLKPVASALLLAALSSQVFAAQSEDDKKTYVVIIPGDDDKYMGMSPPPLSKRETLNEEKRICVRGKLLIVARHGFYGGMVWDIDDQGKPIKCEPLNRPLAANDKPADARN